MLGLLFLTVSPAIYATLWYCHREATKIFTKYENTDKALPQILLASTGELYVQSLRHNYIGYGKTTNRALLDHLYYTYANIYASAPQDNDKRLRAPYDINQPSETLIDQV